MCKGRITSSQFACPGLDFGIVCLTCPKVCESMLFLCTAIVLSLYARIWKPDLIYGWAIWGSLPRKKLAGESFRDAINGHLFFGEQTLVDEYVALASASVKHNYSA